MTGERTITVTCDLHGTPCELVVTCEDDRLILDMHSDTCCVVRLDEPAAGELLEVLGDFLG